MVDEAPHDAATIQPESHVGDTPTVRVPCLTILAHPNMRRVGERATLDAIYDGRVQHLSRDVPVFADPRGARSSPLDSRYVSASKRIELVGRPAGIELRPYDGARIVVGGHELSGPRTVGLAELRGGVVITLARRIALLLHTVEANWTSPPAYDMIGESDAINALRRQIVNVADLGVNVLIRGESGSGKEHVAAAIWRASKRADGPFEACNVSRVPSGDLGLSALFGHVKGAYTGATTRSRGLLERNDGGTVFLDEIGACDGRVQDRLLRVLQDGDVMPVGAERAHRVDVRVLSATDADLGAMVASGALRGPLYHRLAQYVIDVPPLSARRDDVARLAVHFLREVLAETGEPHRLDAQDEGVKPWFPAELMALLVQHDWTGGNVRALANAIRQIVISNRGRDVIDAEAARRKLFPSANAPADPPDPQEWRTAQPRDVSRADFLAAFRASGYSPARTAKALDRPKATIYSWMEQFGIRPANQIERDELVAAFEDNGRDLDATARHFEVSARALQMRLRRLGVEVIPD